MLVHGGSPLPTLRVLPQGISRKRLEQAVRDLGLPVVIARDVDEADVVMTLRNEYKQKTPLLREAEERAMPIYVLKSNTIPQMQSSLTSIFSLEIDPREAAMRETEDAIEVVLIVVRSRSSCRRRTRTSGGCSTRWPSGRTSCRARAAASRTGGCASIRTRRGAAGGRIAAARGARHSDTHAVPGAPADIAPTGNHAGSASVTDEIRPHSEASASARDERSGSRRAPVTGCCGPDGPWLPVPAISVTASRSVGARAGTRSPARYGSPMALTSVDFIGHSALLVELDGIRLLTDPVTRARVGPLRRVEPVPDPHRLAGVDAVLISHLHWDHLDVPSLRDLESHPPIFVPAGSGAWMRSAGFRDVREIALGDRVDIGGVEVEAVEALHSGYRPPLGPTAPALGFVMRGTPVGLLRRRHGPVRGDVVARRRSTSR